MKPPSWPAADHLVEAAAIVEAVRRVHANPELSAEARSDLPAVLDRLHLTGTARGAVAAALAVMSVGPAALSIPRGTAYWQ